MALIRALSGSSGGGSTLTPVVDTSNWSGSSHTMRQDVRYLMVSFVNGSISGTGITPTVTTSNGCTTYLYENVKSGQTFTYGGMTGFTAIILSE